MQSRLSIRSPRPLLLEHFGLVAFIFRIPTELSTRTPYMVPASSDNRGYTIYGYTHFNDFILPHASLLDMCDLPQRMFTLLVRPLRKICHTLYRVTIIFIILFANCIKLFLSDARNVMDKNVNV